MNNKIVEKIKKLLSLANSDNQNEAEIASRKANELLVKFNLSMQDVESAENTYEQDSLSAKAKMSLEDKFILPIVGEHFFVRIVKSRRNNVTTVFILGEENNVEVAKYVYDFLSRAFKGLWLSYRQRTGCSNSHKQSYYYGLYQGLDAQLTVTRKAVEQETGLVVVKDGQLEKFVNNIFNNLKKGNYKANCNSQEARLAGHEAGKNLKISKSLGEGSSNSEKYLSA